MTGGSTTRLSRDPLFLRFWAGRSASFFAAELAHFVLPLTAATLLHASAVQMGLLSAAQTVPSVLVGLVAGAWADRWPRGRLLATADLASAACLTLAVVAATGGVLTIGGLSVLVFLLTSLTVVTNVAYQAMLPSLTGRHRLVSANAFFEVGAATAETLGPGLGGVLLQATSWAGASLIGAASFTLGGLSAVGPVREPTPAGHGSPRPLLPEIVEGVRFVAGHPGLRWVVVCGCVDNLLGIGLYGPLYLLYATRTLGLSSSLLGVVFAATGAGAVLGALMAAPVTTRTGVRTTLIVSQFITGLARISLAFVPADGAVLPTLLAAEFAIGVALPLFNVNLISLRQAVAPNELQGRVNATVGMLLGVASPLGGLVGGVVAEWLGLRAVLGTAAVLTCLVTLVLFLPPPDSLEGHLPSPHG